ncbi:MAG: hypothetical protein HXY40_17440 [Chloroflexi bacterium]|nr:hypothetical protein [Chloroflexota bacterium]
MKKRLLTLLTLLALAVTLTAHAQDTGSVPRVSYFTAADQNGVQQVYQLLLDGQSAARQITRAASDVLTFGAAYDGLSIAYISGGQLWGQSVHTEEPVLLATLSAASMFSSPVYSQDNQYLAYADNGVWLLDLGTRATRQILADVPLLQDGSNMADYRLYQPVRFVLDAAGRAAQLVVDVYVWEWKTVGVYNLLDDTWQQLANQNYTSLLPLSGGRVLIYGNNALSGAPALAFAASLDNINAYTEVVRFADITDATLFAEQAVEITPGVVRIVGSALVSAAAGETAFFAFDYNLISGAGEVRFVTLPASSTGSTMIGQIAPDGTLLPVYSDALWTDTGSVYGALTLFDVATGEPVAAPLPETVGLLRWQP